MGLTDRLPVIPVPLLHPDHDVEFDLQVAYAGAFDSVDYSREIDYHQPLSPPLDDTDPRWVQGLVAGRP